MGTASRFPCGGTLYKIAARVTHSTTTTIDVKMKVPARSCLSKDNFIVAAISGRGNNYGEISGRIVWPVLNALSVNYSPVTGQLTISGPGVSLGYSGGICNKGNVVIDVYVFTGHIKTVSG